MANRKILTMTYHADGRESINEEACSGDCYAYDDVLRVRSDWTPEQVRTTFRHLLKMHSGICGNDRYRLGVDLDEESGTFVGSFLHYGALETVCADTIGGVVEKLATVVDAYMASPQRAADLASYPGLGRSACAYGEDDALVRWMAAAGGVPNEALAYLDLSMNDPSGRAS